MEDFYKGRDSYLTERETQPDLPNIAIFPLVGTETIKGNLELSNSLRIIDCVKTMTRDLLRTSGSRTIGRLENRIIDRGL